MPFEMRHDGSDVREQYRYSRYYMIKSYPECQREKIKDETIQNYRKFSNLMKPEPDMILIPPNLGSLTISSQIFKE